MQRYDAILVDCNNFAYRTFQHKKDKPSTVSKKQVYKKAVCNFISAIDTLKRDYLHSDGNIYLLFDNPTSRIDLQSTFYFADRKKAYAKYKSDRSKEPKEFYNSLDLIKYYYLTAEPIYHTVQVPRLEADDLVEPVLRLYCKDKPALLVTNDLDWARYVNDKVQWLPGAEVEGLEQLEGRLGFKLTEQSLVAYKSLFGDDADNIPSIAPHSMRAGFSALAETIQNAGDLPRMSCDSDLVERYPLLARVRENERQYRINLQLVNAIAVADNHVEAVCTTGRNSEVAQHAVLEAIGMVQPKNSFVFGNIRRPRGV